MQFIEQFLKQQHHIMHLWFLATYRVVFLTGPPDFQYQNEKTYSANEELFYIENFVKN